MRKLRERLGPWIPIWVLSAGVLAAARAALIAFQDEYFQGGFRALALTSFARHYGQGFLGLLLPLLVACVVGRRVGRVMRVGLFLVAAAGSYAFVSCQWPELAYHKPGFQGNAAIGAHLAAATLALATCGWMLFGSLERRSVVTISAALLVAATLLLVPLASLAQPAPASWPERPNVVLVSLDTLRTDHVSAYGYERTTTPAIDEFARHAVRFTRAHAPHPWTLTSHMTMLTGLSPSEHRVTENRALSSQVPTLAEVYADAGYQTLALVDSVVWLDQRFGFGRGFASYRAIHGSARKKLQMLDVVLDDLSESPFFLFLHFFDAHSDEAGLPYNSDDPDFEQLCAWYDGEFDGCDDKGHCASRFLTALNEGSTDIDAQTERYVHDLYDAGVQSMDRQIGELLRRLEDRGLFDNSIIVLTADHGEELRDHGSYLHGTHYQECVSVPLLIRTPHTRPSPTSNLLVSHVDLPTTLLELSGIDTSPIGGRSFAFEILNGVDPGLHEHVFFDTGRGAPGVRLGDWKWIQAGDHFALFDLTSDPGEQHDLSQIQPRPAQLDVLRELSRREFERLQAKAAESEANSVELDEDALRKLGDLGYAGEQR